MIKIKGFAINNNGNSVIKLDGFSIQTNGNLKQTHALRNVHLSQLTDEDKQIIESEVVAYVSKYGTKRQKEILDISDKPQTFEYFINSDERGEFSADVRNEEGKTIFEIEGGEMFEGGFMSHKNDLDGLQDYLEELSIIPENSILIKGN